MNWELPLLFALFFTLIIFRVPVALALGVGGLLGMFMAGIDPVNAVSQLYRGLDSFTILAVPFFLAVGFLAAGTSIGERLLQLSAFLTGWLRGAVGHLNVVTSMLFAGVSGSATADTSGVGAVLIPMMRDRGYSASYSAAITAASSVIGAIIPPSIIMIIYGATASVSVGAMFASGIGPGVLLGVCYMIYNYAHARRRQIDHGAHGAPPRGAEAAQRAPDESRPDDADLSPVLVHRASEVGAAPAPLVGTGEGTALRAGAEAALHAQEEGHRLMQFAWLFGRALPALMVPFILLGGITFGVFTATEAGAIALFYLIVLLMIFYREMGPAELLRTLRQAAQFYSLPLLAAGFATVFGFVVTVLGAAALVRDLVDGLSLSPVGFLLLVVVVFVVVGTFLDQFPAIVLFAPIFLEGATELGIHPLRLGIIVILTLALGYVTPPYGLCLLIAAKLAGVSTAGVARALIPFWVITLGIILLVVVVPEVALFLPRLLYPRLFL